MIDLTVFPRPSTYKALDYKEGRRLIGEYPWDYYLRISQEVAKRWKFPFILKTDVDNELYDIPGPGGIAGNLPGHKCLVDIQKDLVEKARVKHRNLYIKEGDVRSLPFKDGFFDLVIDTSTLDHLHPRDVPRTLQEYHRVLKDGGLCLLFVWCTINGKYAEEYAKYNTWSPTMQFYFQYPELKSHFEKLFKIESEDEFWSISDIFMVCFLGEKCPGNISS